MLRYHKEVYTRPEDLKRVEALTNRLNSLNWQYSGHCLDNIHNRIIDLKGLLLFIKGITLEAGQVFEYYIDESSRELVKVCFRIPYLKELDLILVISKDKNIITVYLNSRIDRHFTLKKELYQRA